VIAAPLLCFGVTLLHELAHAGAALLVGGTVTELSFMPGANNLGHVLWEAPAGALEIDYAFVSVAPYLMWAVLAGAVLLVAAIPNRFHWSVASTLFVWGYAVPIGDIAGNLSSSHGDLAAPGVEGLVVTTAGGIAVLIAWALGWLVQQRLFPEAKLGVFGYVATTLVMGGAWGVAATLGIIAAVA